MKLKKPKKYRPINVGDKIINININLNGLILIRY